MNVITVSSSDFKNNLANYMNMVGFGDTHITVEKHGEPIVEISKPKKNKKKTFDIRTASDAEIKVKLDEYYGAIPDMLSYEEIRKARYFRDRDVDL